MKGIIKKLSAYIRLGNLWKIMYTLNKKRISRF